MFPSIAHVYQWRMLTVDFYYFVIFCLYIARRFCLFRRRLILDKITDNQHFNARATCSWCRIFFKCHFCSILTKNLSNIRSGNFLADRDRVSLLTQAKVLYQLVPFTAVFLLFKAIFFSHNFVALNVAFRRKIKAVHWAVFASTAINWGTLFVICSKPITLPPNCIKCRKHRSKVLQNVF